MYKNNLYAVGRACQMWRILHGYQQKDVADDTGYSIENVSGFEHGRNDNLRILLWYLNHGMMISDLECVSVFKEET